jgi:hypothetical protein
MVAFAAHRVFSAIIFGLFVLLNSNNKHSLLYSSAAMHDGLVTPGGYSPVEDVTHPRLQHLAQFALSEAFKTQQYSFVLSNNNNANSMDTSSSSSSFRICKAYHQVVAGMNVRMVIQLQDSQENCVGAFAVTIYDHFGDLSVTEWSPEEIPCNVATSLLEDANYPETGALEVFFGK